MEYTKKELEVIRSNPFANLICGMMGLDLDKMVDEFIEKEKTSKKDTVSKKPIGSFLSDSLEKLEKEGLLKKVEKDGHVFYDVTDEFKDEPKESEEETVESPKFNMTCEQLESWILVYRKFISNIAELESKYGIDVTSNPNGIFEQLTDIIWDLVRYIFGEDNADDIMDYVYENSNFDSVKDLYEELV